MLTRSSERIRRSGMKRSEKIAWFSFLLVFAGIRFWWISQHPRPKPISYTSLTARSLREPPVVLDNYADLVREARNLHDTRLEAFEQAYGHDARLRLEAYESSVKAGEDPCKDLSKRDCHVYEHNRQVLWSMKRSEWRQVDAQEEDRRKKSGLKDPVIWNGPEKFIHS